MPTAQCVTLVLTVLCLTFVIGQGCPPEENVPPAPDQPSDDSSGEDDFDFDGSADIDGSSDWDDVDWDGSADIDGTSDWDSDGTATTTGSQAVFDELWSTFDQEYSYFTYKGIDWDEVKSRHRPSFAEDLSPEVFAERAGEMLQELHDWHVWIQAPGAAAIGVDEDVELNFPPTLLTSYTQEGSYTTLGDNVIFHATVGVNTAHIVVDTLSTDKFSTVSDADIENLFVQYQNADGMIIDIRNNNGGNENNAIKIASRFINESVVYGYVETRNGPGHDDFDDAVAKTLEPSTGTHYDSWIVCLIGQRCLSSAEWFTLMMQEAGAPLIGDTTRGGSGNPNTHELSNGVMFGVSTWVAYNSLYEVIEDNGITPDLTFAISADASYDETHDYVLERAIDWLEMMSSFAFNEWPESDSVLPE